MPRTQVVIIGGGPAGSFLAHLLDRAGIGSVVLERREREHVLGRIRAGVLEHGSVQALADAQLPTRIDQIGYVHDGVHLGFDDEQVRIDFAGLVGQHVTIYGQTELQKDLYAALDARDGAIVFGAEDVAIDDVTGSSPRVTYRSGGRTHELVCDFVAGCDGYHGVSRRTIPSRVQRTYERTYPFGWLGILAETPPVRDELVYTNHDRGFALCSMRNANLSRYYLQVPAATDLDAWSDDRFWDELRVRLPADVARDLVTGPSIERSIAPLRSFVAEPMRYGQLLLAGDAAHIVPPTGAKGLNLAIGDVVYLARALAEHYTERSSVGLERYSQTALRRVWQAVRFSWWMTVLMHRFDDGDGDGFDRRIQQAELVNLRDSERARAQLAENYVGLPL